MKEAERFWVAYAPENYASGVGIDKAGFSTVAQISFDQHDRPAIRMLVEGAPNPAKMLGLRTIEEALAQCWRCVRMGRTKERSCAPGSCRCDYQKPDSSCESGTARPSDEGTLGKISGALARPLRNSAFPFKSNSGIGRSL